MYTPDAPKVYRSISIEWAVDLVFRPFFIHIKKNLGVPSYAKRLLK